MFEARTLKPGEKISEAGIYDLSMEVYHSQCCVGPSVSSSGLRTLFSKSPAHFWARSSLNPDRLPEEDTEAMILGRAAHHLLLGESDFKTYFTTRPETIDGEPWQGNRKVCKKWLADMALDGMTVLTAKQIEQIRGMSATLAVHPLIQAGILNGDVERSLVYQDEETGIWIKARPDAIPNDAGDFGDLKCTESVDPEKLSKKIGEFRYDLQGIVVGWASKAVLNIEMQSFSLVCVESTAPHCVSVVSLRQVDLEAASADARVALRMLAKCLQTRVWPGPGGTQSDAAYISLPSWTRKQADDRRALLERELAA